MSETPRVDEDPETLRTAMVDQLVASGTITAPAVLNAFRSVSRHAFAPGASLEAAYQDAAVPYEYCAPGVCLGPLPPPSALATLLEAGEVEPGMRVLEIGSGGYAAALLAHLAGASGQVVSVRLGTPRAKTDPPGIGGATASARRFASYDRIIVTAGTDEVPHEWVKALTPDGRLVMPLQVCARQQRIIAFTRDGDLLRSSSVIRIPSATFGAGPTRPYAIRLDEDGSVLEFDDGAPEDAAELARLLSSSVVPEPTGVSVGALEPYADLVLYLCVTHPYLAHLSLTRRLGGLPAPRSEIPVFADRHGSIALNFEFVACGLGPNGARAALLLAARITRWDTRLRGQDPEIIVSPIGFVPSGFEHEARIVRAHSTIHIAFPAAPAAGRGDLA